MFDKLKAMGAVASLLKNQDKIKEALPRVRAKLADTRVTGEAGGGAVRAIVTADLRVVSVEVAPALAAGLAADDASRRLAETYITDAVNDGLRQAQAIAAQTVQAEARDLGIELPPEVGNFLR